MAIMTDGDLQQCWLSLYHKGEGKEEIKADGLLDPATIKAVFQAIEDWFEGQRPAIKAVIDTAAGRVVSDAAIKKYGRAWMRWKWGLE